MTKISLDLIFRTLLISTFLIVFTGCKSEFEQVRTSGEPERIYEKSMEYYENEDYSKAISLMELILSSFRGTSKGEDLYFKYAYANYNQGLYISAANLFETFSTSFPTSKKREEADFMAAYSYYLLSPNYKLDQQYTYKSIDALQLFVNTFPNSDKVDESNTLIDDMRKKMEKKRLEEARLYSDLQQYEAAVQVMENLLKDFPETKSAEEIRYMIILAQYNLASNSIYEKQKERFLKTNKIAQAFLERYPDSKYQKEIEKYLTVSSNKIKEL